ncbi:MAG: hypothetical protein HY705_04165 [Gemmatimonadetes bacterium]|nr:hypothetical protein [Gemmatimonadota bacterium]
MDRRRAHLLLVSLAGTFVLVRVLMGRSPNADFNLGRYNVHHLFVGLLLITLCGVPLALFHRRSRVLDGAAIGFGVGLSLGLDEWVYLIATDGSNASYLLPVSFWGGVVMVGAACLYVLMLAWWRDRCPAGRDAREGGEPDRRPPPASGSA